MKFGKLEDVQNVDFSLPPDHYINSETFASLNKQRQKALVYTGATSWNNLNWKGIIYEKDIKKTALLRKYSRQFNSIELNATHYRTPSDKSIETWKSETPDDFRFCPKILQAISHRNDMLSNKALVNNFIVQLAKLEDKLGQVFLQLPPYFKSKNMKYLESFLSEWPKDLSIAIELRDQSIHEEEQSFKDYLDLLKNFHATPLITDVAGRRDLIHMAVLSDTIFVRWVGNGLVKSDYTRLKEWIGRLEKWAQQGVRNVYFMLHEPDNETTPQIAAYFSEQLENNQYLVHRGPSIIKEQANLFSQ